MPGTDLIEAARKLRMHPFELLLECAAFTNDFSAVWPDVEQGVLGAVVDVLKKRGIEVDMPEEAEAQPAVERLRDQYGLNADEANLLVKMHKKQYYGGNQVKLDVIVHKLSGGKPKRRVQNLLKELARKGYLRKDPGLDGYSLVADKKAQILGVIELFESQSS